MKALRNLIQHGDELSTERGLDQMAPAIPCSSRLHARSRPSPAKEGKLES